ncbi:MAG: hypothetical protein WBM12_10955 [Pseudolabrys sp.]
MDKKRLFQSVAAGFGMVLPAKGPDCSGEIGQAPAKIGDRRLVMELKTSRPNFLFQSIFRIVTALAQSILEAPTLKNALKPRANRQIQKKCDCRE